MSERGAGLETVSKCDGPMMGKSGARREVSNMGIDQARLVMPAERLDPTFDPVI
ncbi:MAG: hypothetical protein OXD29_04425 [Roseovarius sp.]|nr:hypothetical protein [Roseovarius sp.]MCY4315031.1 hypothetical protein [Roseovarius sp.]